MSDGTGSEQTDDRDREAGSEAAQDWSAVEGVANEEEAALVVGFLENQGIPARVMSRAFHLTPTSDDNLSLIDVAVPSHRAEEAIAALSKREQEFDDAPEGEEELLPGDGPVEPDAPAGT